MVDLDQEATSPPTNVNMHTKKKDLLSDAMKRTTEWIFSQEIPSDVTVRAGGASFSLHKFPLVSKCGFIRKLVSESSDADLSDIEIPDVPGGAEAFELAAKFCYGINFDIGTENIAMIRCVAEYLEMTEDHAIGNLVGRTEAYLNEVALKSLGGAVSILHSTEDLLPIAENVKMVNRCIDAIAFIASKESQFSTSGRPESGNDGVYSSSSHSKPIDDWWSEDLTVLRIDMFQRVLIAMMARGFKQYALCPILMLYAQKSLRGLEVFGKGRKKIEPKQEHEKRVVLETIVSLLPREKGRKMSASGGGGCCPPMDLFRSEPMHLTQLIIPVESAHLAIAYLGDLGIIQFKDLNADKSPFQRTYANQIKRCGEMARKLRFFRDQMSKTGLTPSAMSATEADLDVDALEGKLGELEAELIEINANGEKLQRGYSELVEYKLVLEKAGEFFHSAVSSATAHQREVESVQSGEESLETPLLEEQGKTTDQSKQVKLGFLTGLVPKGKSMAFERILFRATRGNVFLNQAAVEDPVTDPVSGEKVEKNVFAVFFSGEIAKKKILKICEAFGANLYPFSEDMAKQAQIVTEVSEKLSELKTTIDAGLLHRGNLLQDIGEQYEEWNLLVRREKSIYHTLNMLSIDVTKKCLVAEGWTPIFATKQIQDALQHATIDSNSQVGGIFRVLHTIELPPTYFKTNKFTSSFQEIVDAYGVAKYQEANPAVYTIVTFPFLFAVMFGDWGHGICLLLATLYFIIMEKKLSSQKLGDIMEMTFGGRYVILMMALFSIYTGLIYNEFFSVPFELFSRSAYGCRDPSCGDATTIGLIKVRETYPFGVDPAWHGSRSELPYLNSLKMKMSILLGVAQMNLGIILSFFNAKFFRNGVNIWCQFIPQIIFLNSLFGYLSILIIMKWCTGSKADLYHVMIYMFLGPTDDLGENQLFNGQKTTQLVLLLLAFVSVPWMLLPKPFLLKSQHNNRQHGQSYIPIQGTDESLQLETNHDSHGHDEFEFSEVFVHQLIHTIEFVLGAVSNTASYLRLWALSLAHSELSSVFYEKVLLLAWGYNNVIILIVGIIVFIFATVGVLLVMETLSAFLHALRLHWVEFQNKFYEGDGYKFYPFSFALVGDEEE